ncbi:Mediator of RNA polymerase II transcription subunit 4 [Zancudomyces culisetae]|uniref:Mediator of RNA polymerase II transcription subunit 4 n=1 Tax=Zancudomyces culisetae TaxID=1213189 RepID=A0A1R1PLM6_ZANCU|nr:Mediator of RNA polymerase II transcription subunit 4 [Zancudomyces culisetae]|eukprot:OMH81870.1 Mediator of RNA polymerase II transcription subunit 4 [Zancudomyces culisetae]
MDTDNDEYHNNTPLSTVLQSTLSEYNENIRSFFGTFDPATNSKASDPGRVSLELKQHQATQKKIFDTQLKIVECDLAKRDIIKALFKVKVALETKIDKANERLSAIKSAEETKVDVEHILSYAQRISPFTSAPPKYNPEKTILPAEPPYPIELLMRAGVLNQYKVKDSIETVEEKALHEEEEFDVGFMNGHHGLDMEADSLLLDLDLNPDLE